MNSVWRSVPVAMGALLLCAIGTHPQAAPMPSACDTLRALPAELLGGQETEFQTTQDRTGDAVLLSMCMALGDDGLPAVTLLLRQDISATDPQTALAQREIMLAELGETFGHDPEARFPDIGEAAMWVAEIRQLTVWYRKGRAMFIVTAMGAGPDTARERAEQIAREIVARFP